MDIDMGLYNMHLDQLRRGGAVRYDHKFPDNGLGIIPHCVLDWMVEEKDAEKVTALGGLVWVRARLIEPRGGK
jgi:hypothetical protein